MDDAPGLLSPDLLPPDVLQCVAARLEIAELLARYCSGIDRCDASELDRVFAEDAAIDYGSGAQGKAATCAGLLAAVGAMRLTQHAIGNIIIEFEGRRARAETYCVALHIFGEPGSETEMTVGGRYLDVLEERPEGWRIVERLYVMDWNRQGPATMRVEGGHYDILQRRGRRKPEDPLYRRTIVGGGSTAT